jgi:regulator of sigma E protease
MGPVMNLLLALVVMAVVLFQGAQLPAYEQQAVVIGSFADKSVGAQAGLKVGDRIATVDGKPVDNWDEFGTVIISKAKRDVSLGIVRAGKPLQISVVPSAQGKYELGDIGVLPVVHPQIEEIVPGQAAEAAGLQKGDVVMGVGAVNDITYDDLLKTIRASENKPLDFHIKRGGALMALIVTPQRRGEEGKIGATIRQLETRTVDPGALEAVKLSFEKNYEWTKMIFQTLGGLFTHETSVKQLMGPVAIADLSGTAAHAGWIPLFSLMAMISLNLGLLNLMPIPVLDGGHIFILALEGLARRDFSMKVKEKMLLGGFVLLLMLMVTVIYNDLMRIQWIEKLVPWR